MSAKFCKDDEAKFKTILYFFLNHSYINYHHFNLNTAI